MQSNLEDLQLIPTKSDGVRLAMKKDAWLKTGMLILDAEQIATLAPFNKTELEAIASYFYGVK